MVNENNIDHIFNKNQDKLDYDNTNYTSQSDILSKVHEGDLLEVEYYSLRQNKRIVNLFVVKGTLNWNYILLGGYDSFSVYDCEFVEKEFNPIIKSIIYKEDLEQIKKKYEPQKKLIYNE